MWISVDAYEYQEFFNILANAFKKEWGESCPHEWYDRNLWRLGIKEGNKKIQFRSVTLFGAPNAYSHEYFWRKNIDADEAIAKNKNGTAIVLRVNAATIILAFGYLGKQLHSLPFDKPLGDKAKAKLLWEEFFKSSSKGSNTIAKLSTTTLNENYTLTGKNVLSILENPDAEFEKYKIGLEEKEILYEYIFNQAKPAGKRREAVAFFSVHKLLSCEEIINLIHNGSRDILESIYDNLYSLLIADEDEDEDEHEEWYFRKKILSEACNHAFKLQNINLLTFTILNSHKFFPNEFYWLEQFLCEKVLGLKFSFFENKNFAQLLPNQIFNEMAPVLADVVLECLFCFLKKEYIDGESEEDNYLPKLLIQISITCWYLKEKDIEQGLFYKFIKVLREEYPSTYSINVSFIISSLDYLRSLPSRKVKIQKHLLDYRVTFF